MNKIVTVKTEYITLNQFLKFSGIAKSGANGKKMVALNTIKVNGVLENKRGKKLRTNDVVEVNNILFTIKGEN